MPSNKKNPKQEFKELSENVVHYVNGHPLALKVLGCFLFRKTVKEWESELVKLKSYPNFEIYKVLKLSYDGLDSNQQEIFLDIACFFRWEKPDFIRKILDACNLFSDTDIRVLVDKSFIKISIGGLQLHDLLKKMGRQVVREESENPGKWSRLWSQKDSRRVLNNDKGTEAVKGLILKLTNSEKVHIGSKSFARMSKLRVLKLFYTPLESPENGSYHRNVIWEDTRVDHSKSIDFLSNELRWLYWHGYPFEFLPSTFYPENLVALNMSYSNMKQLWTGSKGFKKLTLMELRHCDRLTETPDFTEIPNLEELFLEGCTNLVELHPSVGILKKLVVLNLKYCKNLKSFPSTIELESLRILILSGCSKVVNLSEDLGNMRALMELHADGTAIKQFPSSIRLLHSLEALTLGGRKGIPYKSWSSIFWPSFLPRKLQNSSALTLPSLSGLRLIRNLDVSHCNLSGASLNDISCLSLLEKLNLSGNDFVSIPTSFAQLSGLKRLGLVGCKNLQTLPELPSTIDIIDAQDCISLEELPSTMYNSRSLRFDFSNCSKLAENQTIESLASMLVPQGRIDPYRALNMFLPGSRVPKWFTNRNMGDCVRLNLPQPWSYRKFKGFAACAVFAPKNPNGSKGRLIEVDYSVRSFNNAFLCGSCIETRIFPNEIRRFESDQVWLSYMIPRLGWEMRWEKAKDYIDVSFDIYGIYCEVKECGVRLIYEEDDEVGSSSRTIEWLPHDSAEAENEPPSS